MAFKNIVGQNRALEILQGNITQKRVAHAYLFEGDKGVGKYLAAKQLAKALNCLKNTVSKAEPDSCDRCHSCIRIDKKSHPDVLEIQAEDGGQIKVDTIRGLEEFLSFKPFEGRWKVVLIDDADLMNVSAANAFLKTLEEPPGQSMMVLVSNKAQALLETIISRCRRVHFNPLPFEDFKQLLPLRDNIGLMYRLTGGRPGMAMDDGIYLSERNKAMEQFQYLIGTGSDSLWDTIETIEVWLEWAILFLRDMAILFTSSGLELLVNIDLEPEIRKIGSKTNLENILTLAEEMFRLKRLTRFNLNKQLTQVYIRTILKKKLNFNN